MIATYSVIEPVVDLINTKLIIPAPGFPILVRESLHARLEEGLNSQLILLSAPAGSGKTTLVSSWLSARQKFLPRAAWVSLDAGDNDPFRFWCYVFTALQAFDDGAGLSARMLLQSSQQPDYEALLTVLINQFAQRPGKDVLVLEDYHCITNEVIHNALAFLLDHLPHSLHLVLVTRTDPPIPLARLRARNEIYELRASDLRFSEAETHDFLHRTIPNPLPPDAARRLAERTEGWAAGLRLVAHALQRRQDQQEQAQFLDTFTGSHRPILEYLLEEVFASQDETVQEFLLETSLLQCLTAPLCRAVTGRVDSDHILAQIERANLFLQPLDGAGQWYRFHSLFSEAMQHAAILRLGEAHLKRLAYKASLWYTEHGMLSEAVEAALSAQEFEWAAELIERMIAPRLAGNEYHNLLRWIQSLPEPILCMHPRLCMGYAQALLFTSKRIVPGAVAHMLQHLEWAEQYWEDVGDEPKLGELLAFRALLAIRQGNYPHAFLLARQGLARLPERRSSERGAFESAAEWRGICLIFLGWEAYLEGDAYAALQWLTEARSLLLPVGNVYGLINIATGLGEVQALRGEVQQAAEFYQQAQDLIEHALLDRSDALKRQGRALLGRAVLEFERNDLLAAEQDAAKAVAIGQEIGSEELIVPGSWILARVEWSRNDLHLARERLEALAAHTNQAGLLRMVQAWQARLSLAARDWSVAQRWSAALPETADQLPVLYREQEALILARVQIAQGEAEAALTSLKNWLSDAQEKGRVRSEMETRVLIALAEVALERFPSARQSIVEALRTVQPNNYLRVYLDEGEAMSVLLRQVAAGKDDVDVASIARNLLLAMSPGQIERGGGRAQGILENWLTEQEERVLRLLVVGLSNPEIAEDLVISVNTVKTHVKSIYRKLNVNNRRAVRAAARHLKTHP